MHKLSFEEIVRDRLSEEEALVAERHRVIGLLDNIRSLYNVGSCFRTADATLLNRLILTGYTPHPPRREISKTALGADRSVPWEHHAEPLGAIRSYREEGWELWGLELTSEAIALGELSSSMLPERVILAVGNEISGISQPILEECDRTIAIPMYGVKHSLNVAVAFGIAAWELTRLMREKGSVGG